MVSAEIETLSRERKKLGISQATIGRLLGTSEASIFRWESGRSQPSPVYREKITKLLKVIGKITEEMHRNE